MSDQVSDPDKAHGKLYQLSGAFVERTRVDLSSMSTQVSAACEGNIAAAEQLLLMAHRINGTAAMFGFSGISEPARGIERLLRDGSLTQEHWRAVERYLRQLQVAVTEIEENLTA